MHPVTSWSSVSRPALNNPFGKSSDELARILADLETFEPSMWRAATYEIDTSKPLDRVVDQILSLVRQPPPT